MSHTGKLIKKSREELNLTQEELAIKCGMHSQYISNIERGICLPPKSKIALFSRFLKIKRYKMKTSLTIDYINRLKL